MDGWGVGCGAEVGAGGRAVSGWRVLARSHFPATRAARHCHMMFQPNSTVIIDKYEIVRHMVSNNHEYVHSAATRVCRMLKNCSLPPLVWWHMLTLLTACLHHTHHDLLSARSPDVVGQLARLMLPLWTRGAADNGVRSRAVVWRGCVCDLRLGLGHVPALSQPARRLPLPCRSRRCRPHSTCGRGPRAG